jgi:hypothetical protein
MGDSRNQRLFDGDGNTPLSYDRAPVTNGARSRH